LVTAEYRTGSGKPPLASAEGVTRHAVRLLRGNRWFPQANRLKKSVEYFFFSRRSA
jgi:hypothetical protein